ncbi:MULTISPECIES: DUF2497 domain-containing protein [unclassified Sinorhizobium]|uniref:PopZ family protein n=1 Tax=unclassified Sinorhizobium TaxID=2613772 RepID=UPI0035247BCE
MAQPSVAREPSMEEILASIRRIIESNEPGAGKNISTAVPAVYAERDEEEDDEIHLTVDDYVDAPFQGNASPDPRFVAANSPGPVRQSEGPSRTLSLADVAARVRAASERNAAQLVQQRDVSAPREVPAALASRLVEAPVSAPTVQIAAESPVAVSSVMAAPIQFEEIKPVAYQSVVTEAIAVTPVTEPVASEHAAFEEPAIEVEDFQPQVQEEEPRQPLLSPVAGAQVARSFGELAAAIDGAERRSLDEIAQEMLRPMLQEWLDDNLPSLVERLVREEIERVARGPRR